MQTRMQFVLCGVEDRAADVCQYQKFKGFMSPQDLLERADISIRDGHDATLAQQTQTERHLCSTAVPDHFGNPIAQLRQFIWDLGVSSVDAVLGYVCLHIGEALLPPSIFKRGTKVDGQVTLVNTLLS